MITEKNIKNLSKAENFKFDYIKENYLPIYDFKTNNKRKINLKLKKSDLIVNGSNGVGEFIIQDKLWTNTETKCGKGVWELAKLEKISLVEDNTEEINIKMFNKKHSLKNFFRGWRYFYLVEVYANKPGTASEDLFKEWSIRDSDAEEFKDGNPVEFKTLNLTKIIKILNSVANDEFESTLVASVGLNFELTK